MSDDFERLLRDGMRRFTDDVGLPAGGLVRKAQRHNEKRRRTVRAVTAGGTATTLGAVAVVAAGLAGAFGPASQSASQPGSQPAAYVVSRVENALAPASQDNFLQYSRTEYQPATPLGRSTLPTVPLGPGQPPLPGSPSWPIGLSLAWSYHGTSKLSAYSAAGQLRYGAAITMGPPVPGTIQLGRGPITMVLYRNHTWWSGLPGGGRNMSSAGGARPVAPPFPTCTSLATATAVGNGWPGFIRAALRCGTVKVTGRQWIDGIHAIKLAGERGGYTLWVNPADYLPVRAVLIGPHSRVQTDFAWLTPTKAHLALLKLTIPAGYLRVPVP